MPRCSAETACLGIIRGHIPGAGVPDGPFYLRDNIEVALSDGSVHQDTRVTLYWCGASKNKPFYGYLGRSFGLCRIRGTDAEITDEELDDFEA